MNGNIRVLYDWLGFQEPYGGVSRYFTEIIRRLPRDISPRLAVAETRNRYLQTFPFNLPAAQCSINDFMSGKNFKGKRIAYELFSRLMPWRWPSYELGNTRSSADAIRNEEYDVLHLTSPHPVSNNWKRVVGRKPIVVTVHDLIPEIMPEHCRNVCLIRHYRRQMLKDASHIIAVSQNTKDDIMRLYDTPDEKISVVYHGYSQMSQQGVSIYKGMRYVLYVGKRGGYKNSDFFFSAIAPLLREDRSLNVVCTGGEFSEKELTIFKREGIANQMHQKFIPDESMLPLFSDAACFAYPSLYEGFGIPILDAFAAGCPVVLSKSSCFPEVGGDAALYFSIGDEDGLRVAIREAMGVKRDEMVRRGKERVMRFTWQKCADGTASIYRKVCDL